MTYSYLLKLIVIGDQGIGKSNLLKRFSSENFIERHIATIGVEFGARVIKVRNVNLKLQVWDTAGQEAFISITRGYFRAAAGALVVYDITCRESFTGLARWIKEAREHSHEQISYLIVGNKTDRGGERRVSFEEAKQFARKEGMGYLETSAKSGEGVEECFRIMAELILDKISNGLVEVGSQSGVRPGPEFARPPEEIKLKALGPGEEQPSPRCSC